MKSFDELKAAYAWSPIRNCPGRFLMRGGPRQLSPSEILGIGAELAEHGVSGAVDPVIACRIPGGGLISYKKANGTYLHTLNTSEGYERKVTQLGIKG